MRPLERIVEAHEYVDTLRKAGSVVVDFDSVRDVSKASWPPAVSTARCS
jgi:hypothetical protein